MITVKAELAKKLMDVDPVRAQAEVDDLERLSRDALADVRRAVEGYRELTLPGELARARTALEAAEIEAELPNSTDDVPSDRRELFAWTIREGVTNVIRHSDAPTARSAAPRPRRDPSTTASGRRSRRERPRADRAARARRRASAPPSSRGRSTRASRCRWCCRDATETIRLLLADDQALVRGALSALLGLEPDLEVVAEVASGDAGRRRGPRAPARRRAARRGDARARRDRARRPRCARQFPDVRVLIVTTFGRPGFLRRAMQAGASGFVVKDTPAAQLADAVRRVHAGLRVVDPALATDSLFAGESPLTARETDVLRAARGGAAVAAIAKELFLSEGTVRNHLSAAIGKTGAANRAEAVADRRGQRLALSAGRLASTA